MILLEEGPILSEHAACPLFVRFLCCYSVNFIIMLCNSYLGWVVSSGDKEGVEKFSGFIRGVGNGSLCNNWGIFYCCYFDMRMKLCCLEKKSAKYLLVSVENYLRHYSVNELIMSGISWSSLSDVSCISWTVEVFRICSTAFQIFILVETCATYYSLPVISNFGSGLDFLAIQNTVMCVQSSKITVSFDLEYA